MYVLFSLSLSLYIYIYIYIHIERDLLSGFPKDSKIRVHDFIIWVATIFAPSCLSLLCAVREICTSTIVVFLVRMECPA